jgi:hypothetical protein
MIKYPELESVLRSLPPAAHKELLVFVGYLRYKYRIDDSRPVVSFGGLWSHIEIDEYIRRKVADDEFRTALERAMQENAGLMDKLSRH